MLFEYAGDDPNKNRMVSWFQIHCHAIATCLNAELPEAGLVLTYSGTGTFGLLAAPPGMRRSGIVNPRSLHALAVMVIAPNRVIRSLPTWAKLNCRSGPNQITEIGAPPDFFGAPVARSARL